MTSKRTVKLRPSDRYYTVYGTYLMTKTQIVYIKLCSMCKGSLVLKQFRILEVSFERPEEFFELSKDLNERPSNSS